MIHFKKQILLTIICLLPAHVQLYAESRNLALGKKLEYKPEPGYALTASPRNPYLLTDGVKDKSLWYGKYREKTVGWAGAKRVEITIDLGQIHNVGYVNLYTVGCGKPDVDYPEYGIAASSIDGVRYAFACYASSDNWNFNAGRPTPHILKLKVEQRARFIKLIVRPRGYYFFTDEIEVIESGGIQLESPPAHYLSNDQMTALVERARQIQREFAVLETRINQSAEMKTLFQDEQGQLEKTITELKRQISLKKVSEAESVLSAFRRKILHSQYNSDWLVYPVDPMEILRHGDLPPESLNGAEVSLYQWRNEYGTAALNLVNCSADAIDFRMSVSPLHDKERNTDVDSNDIFELRRAVYVRVQNDGLVADPLVLQNSKPFPVAPGQTVQIWLEANSKGLEPGQYTGALAVSAESQNISKTLQTVPIKLEVANKIFPDKVPLLTCNWAHPTVSDRFTSKDSRLIKEAVNDLEKHYINVFVLRIDRILDNKRQGLSLDNLSKELALRSKIHPFVLFDLRGGGILERTFGSLRSEKSKSDFVRFLSQFRNYMLTHGYDYNQFALYPYDERIGDDFINAAQIIRNFDPKLKIYANKWFSSDSQFRQVKDLIDIWCPHLPSVIANETKFDKYRRLGNFDQIWCYYANIPKYYFFSPGKTMIGKLWRGGPNQTAFRTMPIVAVSLGMTGAGFWVYQDKGGWTEDTMGAHGVVYDGSRNPDKDCYPEMLVPSKRWQQWRQGVEDAVCLSGRKDLLDEFSRTPNAKVSSEYLKSLRKRADEK